jgi:NAD(P)-dependent dehydrogenase (short-subunit alcohol dehydrogenase family)
MPKSIAVFGAGPGLGHAVARRYAQGDYEVVLVARRRERLDSFAEELRGAGGRAHVLTADLSDTDAVPALAEQVRALAGELDAIYYAPTPESGFVRAVDLTAQRAEEFMPLVFYSFLALVQQFLPHMLDQGEWCHPDCTGRGHPPRSAEPERPGTSAGCPTQLSAVPACRSCRKGRLRRDALHRRVDREQRLPYASRAS